MRTVFLDRDGVINENRDEHVLTWQQFRFVPGSLEAMCLLTEAGFQLFIVTNQAAVNRGLLSHGQLGQIHRRLTAIAGRAGARIRGLRYCPHRPEEQCPCRKPQPGMLQGLAAEYRVDFERAFLVGDALTDIAAGQAVGCRSILVTTGRGAEQLLLPEAQRWRPAHVARDLLAAAHWILAESQGLSRSAHDRANRRGAHRPEPAL